MAAAPFAFFPAERNAPVFRVLLVRTTVQNGQFQASQVRNHRKLRRQAPNLLLDRRYKTTTVLINEPQTVKAAVAVPPGARTWMQEWVAGKTLFLWPVGGQSLENFLNRHVHQLPKSYRLSGL